MQQGLKCGKCLCSRSCEMKRGHMAAYLEYNKSNGTIEQNTFYWVLLEWPVFSSIMN